MNTAPRIQNFHQFRDAMYGFRFARVLFTAIELELFTIMGHKTWTIPALAKTLKASERGVEVVCRNLSSAKLLYKQGTRFRSSPFARKFLNRHSQSYRGSYLKLMSQQWADWSQLTHTVKTGSPIESQETETPQSRRAFTLAMHERSVDPARHVARQLDLKHATSLLDLGGGPGTYALAFLAKNPKLQATVMDRPAALNVAKAIAKTHRAKARLSYLSGDFLTNRIPDQYDIIWLSNIIHIYSASINTKLFRKLKRHLKPGGRILIQDTFLLDHEGLHPFETNLFAITMLLFTETGNTYHFHDVFKWLTRAGFHSPGMIQLHKGTGDWDGVILEGFR